ncbi:MAG: hypothetical protein ACRCU2_03990 [Planktothrix sp.]
MGDLALAGLTIDFYLSFCVELRNQKPGFSLNSEVYRDILTEQQD